MDYIKYSGCYRPLLPVNDQSVSDIGSPSTIPKTSPENFAKQITIIELSFFKAIKREEFSSLKWNGKEKHIHAPNIVASTRWFNQLNFWVQKEILKVTSVSKRTDLLAFFIRIAKKLVDHNNLYSAMSIVSALQVECIYRLRDTWGGLSNKDRTAYRNLEELFSQENNCHRQREHMKSISLPGIPYLGLYLSDLTYTNVAHPRVGGKLTDIWISKINSLIDTIVFFQQSEYPFVVDETINSYLRAQKYIEELQKFIEEDNYRTSLRLEPPESPTEPPLPVCHPLKNIVRDRYGCEGELSVLSSYSPSNYPSLQDACKPVFNSCTSALKNPNFEPDFMCSANSCTTSAYSDAQTSNNLIKASSIVPSAKEPGAYSNLVNSYSTTDADQVDLKTAVHKEGLENDSLGNFSVDRAATHPELSKYQFCNNGFTANCSDIRHLPPIPPRPSFGQCVKTFTLPPDSSLSSDIATNHDISERCLQPSLCSHLTQLNSHGSAHGPYHRCSTPDTSEYTGAYDPAKRTTLTPVSSIHSDVTTNQPITPYCSIALSASAVCAAAVAREAKDGRVVRSEAQSECTIEHKLHDTHPVVFQGNEPHLLDGVTAPTTTPCEPDSTLNNHSVLVHPFHQYPNSLLGVRVIHQGVVQRRLLSQSLGSLDALTQLFSTRFKVHPPTVDTSFSSFSSSPHRITELDHTWSQARPTGFSPWRRFWATLVLVTSGSAAFMIYFAATSKKSISREEFETRHCEIQPLMNMPTNSSATNFDTWHSDNALRRSSLEPLSPSSRLSVKSTIDRSLTDHPHFFPSPVFSQVDVGRHRDGSIDPSSFLLLDASSRRVYRFRPVSNVKCSQSPKTSIGSFGWLRRGGLRDSKISPHSSRSATPALTRATLELSDSVSLPRPSTRLLSATLSSTAPSDCPSNWTTLERCKDGERNAAGEWIHLLSLVLNHLRLAHVRDSIR